MKLHLDKLAFDTIISNVSKREKIRRDILEKDYYVTLILNELSKRENQGYAYFKGGTALYKGMKSIRRFSEDIDLTVCVYDCNNSQKKKRLIDSTKFNSLQFDKEVSNKKGSIETQYSYASIYDVDSNDKLQRFGKLKIESTNFGISEPTDNVLIAPQLYDYATKEEQIILKEKYEVCPFNIITLSIERIFMDKLFAAEHYYRVQKYFDLSKHLYDLSVLMENERISNFIKSKTDFLSILKIQIEEEMCRYGGISDFKTIDDLTFFKGINNNNELKINYNQMQTIYVFSNSDIISFDELILRIEKLYNIIYNFEIVV